MVYGLDIGGTKMELTIFDAMLNIQYRWRIATPSTDYRTFLQTIRQQIALADEYVARMSTQLSTAFLFESRGSIQTASLNPCDLAKPPLGIAMPGVQLESGRLVSSNIQYLNQQVVMLDLIRQLKRPVAIGNDCRLFALSEAKLGAGRGFRRVLGVVLGTGAGAGFCIDGELLAGTQGVAGEFGHQSIAARVVAKYQLPLFECGCGLVGCVEGYISGAGLGRLYQHFGGTVACSHQWLRSFRLGCEAAHLAFDCYLAALGAALAAQVLAYEPEIIVVGGGLSEITEITRELPSVLASHLFSGVKLPQFQVAEFGATSGGRGAALAVLNHLHG